MLHERTGFASDPLIYIAILKEIRTLKKMKDNRAGFPVIGGNSADPVVMEGSNTQRRSEIVPELIKNDAGIARIIADPICSEIVGDFLWIDSSDFRPDKLSEHYKICPLLE
ncbi:hypothetical protein AVEN_96234-1 [Araneus ventricosus]|uniref:Uncharacterized protein n=1 Tax=Araneus ventricosus TaxID=182803 RepID=A0A4Y2KU12_ARAVE|nr:hypothetical protein AVEN_96234-1 [Araneus ventricosus]